MNTSDGILTPIYNSSFIVAILIWIASAIGLQYNILLYPIEELARTFIPNDVVNLLIGLPILLSSVYLAWRRK